jgi:hypothetical protein
MSNILANVRAEGITLFERAVNPLDVLEDLKVTEIEIYKLVYSIWKYATFPDNAKHSKEPLIRKK